MAVFPLEPVFDKELVAIARCQDVLTDFTNLERWRILEYLQQRYSAPPTGSMVQMAREKAGA
jgi:hypothetical protein